MHPGPVNRGVELSGEVVDSPQAVITAQVEAGVVVRMAVLYEVLAARADARPRARPDRAAARMTDPTALVCAAAPPAALLIRDAHVLDPREQIDARHDLLIRGGEIAEIGAPNTLTAPDGAETIDASGRHVFPAFVDPHVHLRTPGPGAQGGHRDGHPRRRRRRLLRRDRDAQHRPGRRHRPDPRRAARPRRPRGARPGRLHRLDHPRPGRRPTDRDGRAARRGRGRVHRRRQAGHERRDAAPRAPVPAPVRRRARAARGGPVAVAGRRDARGPGLGAARRRRHPGRQRVDDDRPRLRAGRLRGRRDPHPAPERRRVGRGDRRRPRPTASPSPARSRRTICV